MTFVDVCMMRSKSYAAPLVVLRETALTQGRCPALTDYLFSSALFGSGPAAAPDTLCRRLSH